jgi:catechol 2,3-dioxygenase-like lactoylglutathione lyase family enzyme
VRLAQVALRAPAGKLATALDFYSGRLELRREGPAVAVGETTLTFAAGDGEPFYHAALLVPGDRFDAAFAWARDRVEIVADAESGDLVAFSSELGARACYFHDPAGNILELIAHAGIGEYGATGPFESGELLGLAELGLVGDRPAMASALARLGIHLWRGSLDEPDGLAFAGERGRTLILCPPGRGWLPLRRPAEPHPAELLLAGVGAGSVELEAGRYRIGATGAAK